MWGNWNRLSESSCPEGPPLFVARVAGSWLCFAKETQVFYLKERCSLHCFATVTMFPQSGLGRSLAEFMNVISRFCSIEVNKVKSTWNRSACSPVFPAFLMMSSWWCREKWIEVPCFLHLSSEEDRKLIKYHGAVCDGNVDNRHFKLLRRFRRLVPEW